MRALVWESVQEARKVYFCDFCCSYIERGETYVREVLATRHGLLVLRQHDLPSCVEFEGDFPREGTSVPVEVRIAIALVTEIHLVQKIGLDGKIITEQEPHLVPQMICEPVVEDDSDTEILF